VVLVYKLAVSGVPVQFCIPSLKPLRGFDNSLHELKPLCGFEERGLYYVIKTLLPCTGYNNVIYAPHPIMG